MKIGTKEKKTEAINRMRKLLKIPPEIVQRFKEENLISIQKYLLETSFLTDDKIKKTIANFEKKYNVLVYFGIRTCYKELEKTDSFFYVSDEKERWQLERDSLKIGQANVYVYDYVYPELSDFGEIGFNTEFLLRSWCMLKPWVKEI